MSLPDAAVLLPTCCCRQCNPEIAIRACCGSSLRSGLRQGQAHLAQHLLHVLHQLAAATFVVMLAPGNRWCSGRSPGLAADVVCVQAVKWREAALISEMLICHSFRKDPCRSTPTTGVAP